MSRITHPAWFGFRGYVRYFTNYASTHGTLGAFFVLMLWVYVESLINLVAGEINSEMEKFHAGNRPNKKSVGGV